MGATILSFSNNLLESNKIVVGDASFIYDYYYSSNLTNGIISFKPEIITRMEEVKNFSDELVKNNNIIVIPPICKQELIQACERDVLGKENYTSKQQMTRDNTLLLNAHTVFTKMEQALSEDPLFYFDDSPLNVDINEVFKISSSENLKFKDANYVYYSRLNDLKQILTVDKDFVRMNDPSFDIYINSAGYNFYLSNTQGSNSIMDAFLNASKHKK